MQESRAHITNLRNVVVPHVNLVAHFMAKIPAQTVATVYTGIHSEATLKLRGRLTLSETLEKIKALGLTWSLDEKGEPVMQVSEAYDDVQVLDALCDILYVVYGAAVAFGYPLQAAFELVHANNMLKHETGTIDAGGKLVKAKDHPDVAPQLAQLLEMTMVVGPVMNTPRESLAQTPACATIYAVQHAEIENLYGLIQQVLGKPLALLPVDLFDALTAPVAYAQFGEKLGLYDYRALALQALSELPPWVTKEWLPRHLNGELNSTDLLVFAAMVKAIEECLPINKALADAHAVNITGYKASTDYPERWVVDEENPEVPKVLWHDVGYKNQKRAFDSRQEGVGCGGFAGGLASL